MLNCYSPICAKKNNRWAVMESNPGYYAFCGVTETYMYKCRDENNYVFNIATEKCEFDCRGSVTNYPDRTDCTQYISCDWENGVYQAVHLQCPPKYKFDNTTQSCVPSPTYCISEISPPQFGP